MLTGVQLRVKERPSAAPELVPSPLSVTLTGALEAAAREMLLAFARRRPVGAQDSSTSSFVADQ